MQQVAGKTSLKKAFCEGRWAREGLPGEGRCLVCTGSWRKTFPGAQRVQGSLAEVRGQQKSDKASGRGKGF